MMRKIIFTLILLCATILSIWAQEDSTGQASVTLSLEEAKSMAIERNKTLMNASLDTKIAEANRWKAISTMLPQANANLDYSNMCGYQMDFSGMNISMPPSGQLGITVAMALSGAQIVSTQLGKIAMDMSDISLKKTEQDIVDQVRVLYYSALVSEETEILLNRNLESIEKLYGYAKKSADVGVTEQIDADQILVQVATMRTTLNSTRRAKEMVYNSMRVFLDLDVNTEITLSQGMDDLLSIDTAISLVNEEFIMDNNYGYQLLQKNTELSKKQIAMAGWAYGPQLSAFYQYTGKKYFSDEKTFNMTPPNMVGLSLKIPIFSSGTRYSALTEAKMNYKKQQNTLAETENSLLIQHRQLVYNLKSAYERYETQKQNIDVTQRVFNNISKKFEFGTASSIDVTTSGTNLITAQTSYVQSLLDFVNAQISLEKLLNK